MACLLSSSDPDEGFSLSRCTHPRKVAARRGVPIVQIIDYRNQAVYNISYFRFPMDANFKDRRGAKGPGSEDRSGGGLA
jgi:hypothetical protein